MQQMNIISSDPQFSGESTNHATAESHHPPMTGNELDPTADTIFVPMCTLTISLHTLMNSSTIPKITTNCHSVQV